MQSYRKKKKATDDGKVKNSVTKRRAKDVTDQGPLSTTGEASTESESDLGLMTLDTFRLWTPHALQAFLGVRGKSTEGSYDELVARAFITWEEKIDVDPTSEHSLRTNLQDYKRKLLVGDDPLPDPFTIKTGWLGESGMSQWPPVYFHDIAEFFKTNTASELYHRLLCEYKEGKGLRYFTDNHVQEVHFHPVSHASTSALFSARVKPSMRSIHPHQVWVAVEKTGKGTVGGSIQSAYCTCTAGLQGSCNHVAGVLFRVEYFVRTGKTNPTCTSVLSKWNTPSGPPNENATDETRPLSHYLWKKDQYMNLDHDDHQKSVRSLALDFTPLSATQQKYASSDSIVDDFAEAFREVAPNSCFIRTHYAIPFPTPKKIELPPSPVEVAQSLDVFPPLSQELLYDVKKQFSLSKEQRAALEEGTRQQKDSDEWKEQRKGRVTASQMKRVYTRSVSLAKDPTKDPTAVIKEIMGYEERKMTLSMKHGLSMEKHGKVAYQKEMRKKHRRFVANDSGLVIDTDSYCLGASPDLIVSCLCHGKGLCEIKCPSSIVGQTPSNENWPDHLCYDPNTKKVHLRKNSEHFFQIQAQMGILKLEYCDYFVYTSPQKHHLERVLFDKDFWNRVSESVTDFWGKYILVELLTGEHAPNNDLNVSSVSEHSYAQEVQEPQNVTKPTATRSTVKTPLTKPLLPPVYPCGTCGKDVEEESEDFAFQSIGCDNCKRWFHFVCVNLTENDVDSLPDTWLCDGCTVTKPLAQFMA